MSWNQEDKQGFIECSEKHTGQINIGSKLGDLIYSAVASGKYNIVYDIGCWNGEGSTKCIVKGLEQSPDTKVYGFEVNAEKYQHCANLYQNVSNVIIVHGTVKHVTLEQIQNVFPNMSEQFLYWCKIDIENSMSCEEYTPHEQIDLVVHDGGEWDSWFAFLELKSKVREWILDDTNTDKNKMVFENLSGDPNYTLVQHEPNDRNGWAWFKRV